MMIRPKAVNYIFGAIYSLAIVLGFQCEYFGEIKAGKVLTYVFILLIFAAATLFSAIAYEWFDKHIKSDRSVTIKAEDQNTADKNALKKHEAWLYIFIIWLLYLIVLLGVYPGFFVYDAQDELMEVVIRSFSNQQPIAHVLLLGGVLQAVHKLTGDYNTAIFIYLLLQETFISAILGLLVSFLRKEGLKRKWGVLLSIYFGAFPVLTMYALCSAKDGLFGTFLVVFGFYVSKLIKEGESFFDKKINPVLLTITGVLLILLRSNAIYAYVIFGIVLLASLRKICFKKLLPVVIITLVAGFLINTALLSVTKAEKVGHKEILTVPIQVLARVYAYDNASLSADEKSEIEKYINKDALKTYNPKCSDPVKAAFIEEAYESDKKGFYGILFKEIKKHPVSALDAWLMTAYGLFYPNATIDGYKGNEVFTFTYGDSSYFGYETEEPGVRASKIPFIDSLYRWLSLDVTIQHVPIVRYLFSPGFMLLMFIFLLGYLIYAGAAIRLMPYMLPLICILTCLIGPMSLVRYSYYLWIFVPLLWYEIHNLKLGTDNE